MLFGPLRDVSFSALPETPCAVVLFVMLESVVCTNLEQFSSEMNSVCIKDVSLVLGRPKSTELQVDPSISLRPWY